MLSSLMSVSEFFYDRKEKKNERFNLFDVYFENETERNLNYEKKIL